MTDKEVADMIRESGLQTTYYQYPAKQVPPLPYTVYYFPNTDNFGADDKVYTQINALNIELYTAVKSPAVEAQLEAVLESHNLFWNKPAQRHGRWGRICPGDCVRTEAVCRDALHSRFPADTGWR